MKYEPIIGLEIHVELKTKSKMFCGCPADHFGKKPNTQTCPVCLGFPGALPVPNGKAVEWTIMLGRTLGSEIAEVSKFDRKHYFYPDLAKGYQISQYDQPLCRGGKVSTSFGDVRIHRVHLEEDTGKLQHATVNGKKVTLVDFNRSGVPLVEIVTEADIRSSEQAKEFLKKLHQIVRYLGISDADMEKGSMRLEPNISVRVLQGSTLQSSDEVAQQSNKGKATPVGSPARLNLQELPAYKVEVKNINSFRFAERAINFEIERQSRILDEGKIPVQETRGWDEAKGATVSQRSKEEAADYRYFPEPDIPPMRISPKQITDIKAQIPELPDAKLVRFTKDYGLNKQDSARLTETRALADYFEEAVRVSNSIDDKYSPKDIANWIINKKPNINDVLPAKLIETMREARQVVTISGTEIRQIVVGVIVENPQAVTDYKKGKEAALMFLMGKTRAKLPKVDSGQLLAALKKELST